MLLVGGADGYADLLKFMAGMMAGMLAQAYWLGRRFERYDAHVQQVKDFMEKDWKEHVADYNKFRRVYAKESGYANGGDE